MEEDYLHRIENIAGKNQDDILAELLTSIEENIGELMTKKETRRLFTVITEIVQNIQKYAIAEKENYFEVGYDNDQNVVINTKNFAEEKDVININTLDDELSGINKNNLLEKYNLLLQDSSENKSSRGLGIIYIKLNSIMHRYKTLEIDKGVYQVNLKVLY